MTRQTTRQILTRDFILAFLAQFASSFIFFILIPTLPIYLAGLGSGEIETGILLGAFFFASLICRPFVGKALIRTPERKFMIIGSSLYGFASLAYILAPPFFPFCVVRILHGIGFGFFHTASFTFIANIASKDHRGRSLGYFSLSMTVSAALAPSIGMLLINNLSFIFLFLSCFGLSLCTLFMSHQLGRAQNDLTQAPSAEEGTFINRKAVPASVTNSISLFMWGALAAFFPLYAIGHGVTNPGLFFTTIAVMLILGRSLGSRILDLYNREKVIVPCLVAYILSMAILAFSETLSMFIFVGVIFGIGNAFLMPSLVAYVLDREGSSPGPAMGTFTAISDLGLSLGPMIMGMVIHMSGYPAMFLCLAFTGVINLVYFYFFVGER
ncbi:MAG: MFS transporter [Deltaproteobacteria bacterium]|nr:MFS transporter [Deltaproteobacteria bacterium]